METATITITIKVESSGDQRLRVVSQVPEDLTALIVTDSRASSGQTPGDAEAVRAAVKRLNGRVSRQFVKEVAEKSLRGGVVTVDQDLAKRYGFDDGGSLGGAIGTAASQLEKATGRWVLERIGRFPSVWKMLEDDARVVLAALDEGLGL
jgi:hypothetical protein